MALAAEGPDRDDKRGKELRLDTIASFLAEYFYLIVLVLAVGLVLIRYRNHSIRLAIAAVCIGGIAYLLSKIGGQLISSPRPFTEAGAKAALIPSAHDNGFPSDHTMLLATVAAIITLVEWQAGIVFWIFALLVGLCRVYVGVHHLIDIVGSFVIVAIALGIYLLGKTLVERWLFKKNPDVQPILASSKKGPAK
jgi:membrane-associated phospholipid phosphatase